MSTYSFISRFFKPSSICVQTHRVVRSVQPPLLLRLQRQASTHLHTFVTTGRKEVYAASCYISTNKGAQFSSYSKVCSISNIRSELMSSTSELLQRDRLRTTTAFEDTIEEFEAHADEDDELITSQEIWDIAPATPTRSFTFGPYANDSEVIQKFVQLGVEVYHWEVIPNIPEFILKLNFNKDIAPYIRFLSDQGVYDDNLARYITQNPFILKENLRNLEARISYLRLKKFDDAAIGQIMNENPHWILLSTERLDRRLGFFQGFFVLTGSEVRKLATIAPKLITHNLRHVHEIVFALKEQCGFEAHEIKRLLFEKPTLFHEIKRDDFWTRFDCLHNELGFTHEQIVRYPECLHVTSSIARSRVGFLKSVGRAQFNPLKPNFISPNAALSSEDPVFATQLACSSTQKYNEYLKTL